MKSEINIEFFRRTPLCNYHKAKAAGILKQAGI